MGVFLVNCCLQTGQGFVVAYVITLRLPMESYLTSCNARRLPQDGPSNLVYLQGRVCLLHSPR